jgi:hypothetical protein
VGYRIQRRSRPILEAIAVHYPGWDLVRIADHLGVALRRVRYVYKTAVDRGVIRLIPESEGRFRVECLPTEPMTGERVVSKLYNWSALPGNSFAILKSLRDDYPRLTMCAIGVRHGVTNQRVQQIWKKAVEYGLLPWTGVGAVVEGPPVVSSDISPETMIFVTVLQEVRRSLRAQGVPEEQMRRIIEDTVQRIERLTVPV